MAVEEHITLWRQSLSIKNLKRLVAKLHLIQYEMLHLITSNPWC